MNNSPPPIDSDSFLAAAERQAANDLAGAASIYLSILTQRPDHAPSLCNLGIIYTTAGRHDEAIELLKRARGLKPGDIGISTTLASALRLSGRVDEAIAVLRDIEARARPLPEISREAGLCAYAQGNFTAALEHFDAVMAATPAHEEILFYRQRCLLFSGDESGAHQAGLDILRFRDNASLANWNARGLPSPELLMSGARPAPHFDPTRPERNLIAFSLWGNHQLYCRGAIANAREARNIYPGWTTRFYCGPDLATETRDLLEAEGAQIIAMPAPEAPWAGLFWRFLAVDAEGIDRVIFRDADSRLNHREAMAVAEWVESGLPFHVMRDSLQHEELVLAGMWGVASIGILHGLRQAATQLRRNAWFKNTDQIFLAYQIWPLMRNHALVHDSAYRFGPNARDFPPGSQRPDELHVGSVEPNP